MKHSRRDYDPIQDPRGIIPPDEPVFLLRGQDTYAYRVVEFYADMLHSHGLSSDFVRNVRNQAMRMANWLPRKSPDLALPVGPSEALAELHKEALGVDVAKPDIDVCIIHEEIVTVVENTPGNLSPVGDPRPPLTEDQRNAVISKARERMNTEKREGVDAENVEALADSPSDDSTKAVEDDDYDFLKDPPEDHPEASALDNTKPPKPSEEEEKT